MLLGDDNGLTPGLQNAFRRSGLYHLLAVSGQNVVLLAGGVLGLALLLGIPRVWAHLGALAAIAAYVLAVGPQPSVIRAAVSGAAISIAWLAARERDPWHVLLLAAVVLLAWNPYTLFDAGFQLSFAAVVAIFLAVGPLLRLAEGYPVPQVARRGGRGLGRVQRRDRADPLAAVRGGAAARDPGERAGRTGRGAAARAGVRGRRGRPGRTVARRGPGVAERLARRLHRALRAARGGCPGRTGARFGRGARGRRVAPRRRLCLAGMADELKPAYLIAGSDRPKVDRTVARLRARFDVDAVEVLRAADTTGDDAVAACNVMGLFGAGTRLVVVEGVEEWKAPEAKAIAAYLKAPAPGTTLALVGAELKKDSPLAKAVAAKGELLIWDVVLKSGRPLDRRPVQAAQDEGRAGSVPPPRRARRRRPLRARR